MSFLNLRLRKQILAGVVVLSMAMASTFLSAAQSVSDSRLRRDSEAVKIITQALDQMGGQAAWTAITDSTASGSCDLLDPTGKSYAKATFRWVTAGKEHRYEFSRDGQTSVHLSGGGSPRLATPAGTVQLSPKLSQLLRPYHIPSLALEDLLKDGSRTLIYEGEERVAGSELLHITSNGYEGASVTMGSTEDWWFDPQSGLPVKVRYSTLASIGVRVEPRETTFQTWTNSGNLRYPAQIQDSLDGRFAQRTCSQDSVTFNTNPNPHTFDAR